MSGEEISNIPSLEAQKLRAQQLHALKQTGKIDARQDAIKDTLEDNSEYAIFEALERSKHFKTNEERFTNPAEEAQASEEESSDLQPTKKIETEATRFAQKNSELNPKALVVIRSLVHDDDTPEEIIGKIRSTYPDHYLTDETIDFLLSTTKPGSKHHEVLLKTKDRFNTIYDREIKAGRNISTEAKAFSKEGLGTPTGLRDLYRDITGNPRPPLQLFDELMKSFDFAKMKKALDFILHSLGTDMKSKGPSISRGELQTLFAGARSMQAILGVFSFFKSRMGLISGQFQKEELGLPTRLNFQLLAEQFMKLISERYPSTDKVLRLARALGLSDEYIAQVIIFTQYRDAMRNISPKLLKSERHRQDLLRTILDALSELEDLLDEDEDEEEEEDKPKKGPRDFDSMESMEGK